MSAARALLPEFQVPGLCHLAYLDGGPCGLPAAARMQVGCPHEKFTAFDVCSGHRDNMLRWSADHTCSHDPDRSGSAIVREIPMVAAP